MPKQLAFTLYSVWNWYELLYMPSCCSSSHVLLKVRGAHKKRKTSRKGKRLLLPSSPKVMCKIVPLKKKKKNVADNLRQQTFYAVIEVEADI